ADAARTRATRLMRVATLLLVLGLVAPARAGTNAGNAWHIPVGTEPGIAAMRGPVHGIVAGTNVLVYSGNQFQGTGNPGNQLQAGSAGLSQPRRHAASHAVPLTIFADK